MKLNARQVNVLKAHIEGNNLTKLYDRLIWDNPKNVKLNTEEKDTLLSMLDSDYTSEECKEILKQIKYNSILKG